MRLDLADPASRATIKRVVEARAEKAMSAYRRWLESPVSNRGVVLAPRMTKRERLRADRAVEKARRKLREMGFIWEHDHAGD